MMFYDDQFIIHIFWLSNATNAVFLFFCAEKKQRQLHELTGSARSKFFHGVNFATEQVHLLGLLLPHFHHQKKQFATPRVLPPSHSQLYAQVRSSKWGLCQFRSDISEIWGSQCCVGIESPGIMGWPRIIVMISTAGCKCFKQLLHSLPLQAFSLAPGACDPSVDYHSVCTYTSIYVIDANVTMDGVFCTKTDTYQIIAKIHMLRRGLKIVLYSRGNGWSHTNISGERCSPWNSTPHQWSWSSRPKKLHQTKWPLPAPTISCFKFWKVKLRTRQSPWEASCTTWKWVLHC